MCVCKRYLVVTILLFVQAISWTSIPSSRPVCSPFRLLLCKRGVEVGVERGIPGHQFVYVFVCVCAIIKKYYFIPLYHHHSPHIHMHIQIYIQLSHQQFASPCSGFSYNLGIEYISLIFYYSRTSSIQGEKKNIHTILLLGIPRRKQMDQLINSSTLQTVRAYVLELGNRCT